MTVNLGLRCVRADKILTMEWGRTSVSAHRIEHLVCPVTHQELRVQTSAPSESSLEVTLTTADGLHQYPVSGGIPRFVPRENYADSFGYQWNNYARLQLDSFNGTSFSHDRFYSITEWDPRELKDKRVLDVGCGAGRFAEIALNAGAQVTAIDLSDAVDACQRNLGGSPSLNVVQASIYELPFRPQTFDYVYCIGVVQHTPNPNQSIVAICDMVKPGGHIGLWIYERNWKSLFGTLGFKYALRPFTKKMSRGQVERFSNALERLCWPVNRLARRCGFAGKVVMRMLPVSSFHLQDIPLNDKEFREWVRLDTFDMYSPAHDHPLTFDEVASWLQEAGFTDIRRRRHPGISVTARRSE